MEAAWRRQPKGDIHTFLAVKDWTTGEWEDHEYEGEIPTVEDLYFAPNTYSGPHRRKPLALPGRWLYADLDEVDPESITEALRPTLAWETSPGKWQAMWLLRRPLKPATLGPLNQRLTYFTGADKGGWSLTKVLRVPGSYSNKYEGSRFRVELAWDDGPVYEASDILNLVRNVETPGSRVTNLPDLVLPKADAARLYRRHRPKLGIEARKLLRAEVADSDRSQVLWKLERMLLEAGIPPNQVFVMVKASVWNKYKGQRREDTQLWTEIQSAIDRSAIGKPSKATSPTPSPSSSEKQKRVGRRMVGFDDFINRPTRKPMWMVEGIWSESAHGILAGEPKTYKSVLSTDLAISVASGTRFLDHFPVPQQGPVFMIQKENDEAEVQDRVMRIAWSKALVGQATIGRRSLNITPNADLPINFLNNADFDLTDDGDMRWLRRQIRKLNPVLVILDPLYLLAPGVDENSAHEMTPILEKLLKIKQAYSCGTLLVHHYKKQDSKNPIKGAARISGTGVFHRWFESALLLERPEREDALIRMTPEHRGHKPGGAIWAEFDLGTEADLHYSCKVTRRKDDMDASSRELLGMLEGASTEGVLTINAMADRLGMTPNGVRRRLEKNGIETDKMKVNGRTTSVVRLPE